MKNEKDSGDGETMFKNQEKERVDDRELGHRKIARTQQRRSGVEERRGGGEQRIHPPLLCLNQALLSPTEFSDDMNINHECWNADMF